MNMHTPALHRDPKVCDYCAGSGVVLSDMGPSPKELPCPDCDGAGRDGCAWYETPIATFILADIKRLDRLSADFVKRYGDDADLGTINADIGYIEAQRRFGHRTRFSASGIVGALLARLDRLRDEHIERRRIEAVKANGWEPLSEEADEYDLELSDEIDSVSLVLEREGL